MNFLKNSRSFSEYSIFPYSFASLLCLLLCTFFQTNSFSQVSQNSNIWVFSQLPTTLGSLWILPLIPVLQFPLVRVSSGCPSAGRLSCL